MDDLLNNAESALYAEEALAGVNSETKKKNGTLPDIKTLLLTKVPNIRFRYVPIKVRYKRSKLFFDIITDCYENPNTELN